MKDVELIQLLKEAKKQISKQAFSELTEKLQAHPKDKLDNWPNQNDYDTNVNSNRITSD